MNRTIIFPGSFDPFTRGHAALVEQALRLFDQVIICIGCNTSKRGLLSIEQRIKLIEDIYASNPRVKTLSYDGLTGDFALSVDACAMLRGVRNTIDFEYEKTLEMTNKRLFPELETVLLFTPAPLADICSSTVRELLHFNRPINEFMVDGIDLDRYIDNK